ncbi:related to esterase [Cephalotrichum gorgonifer]|uniref:Related to esterase n=1 Tax=Cephalotrichum gorgonifer TaxID=2041049 RepID=A0AAE8MQ43_9PEZI|nr:related to esterase [Cephalotrichum gorgonifer]
MPPPAAAPLRVLCFGDSLTSGYHAWGCGSHPYSTSLAARLHAAFPRRRIEVATSGVPGDIACGAAFCERMKEEWTEGPFEWTIVLAGTNDIGRGWDAGEILSALREAWDIPLSKGSKVLALTIPETSSKAAWAIAKRNEVNAGILSHKDPNVYPFDLHAVLPYHSLTPDDCHKYWDDGLHLTPDGYDWMAGHIASHLISLLNEIETQSPTPFAPVPRKATDDEVIDEEAGDPKRLSRGYVFVRRTDLH